MSELFMIALVIILTYIAFKKPRVIEIETESVDKIRKVSRVTEIAMEIIRFIASVNLAKNERLGFLFVADGGYENSHYYLGKSPKEIGQMLMKDDAPPILWNRITFIVTVNGEPVRDYTIENASHALAQFCAKVLKHFYNSGYTYSILHTAKELRAFVNDGCAVKYELVMTKNKLEVLEYGNS